MLPVGHLPALKAPPFLPHTHPQGAPILAPGTGVITRHRHSRGDAPLQSVLEMTICKVADTLHLTNSCEEE